MDSGNAGDASLCEQPDTCLKSCYIQPKHTSSTDKENELRLSMSVSQSNRDKRSVIDTKRLKPGKACYRHPLSDITNSSRVRKSYVSAFLPLRPAAAFTSSSIAAQSTGPSASDDLPHSV